MVTPPFILSSDNKIVPPSQPLFRMELSLTDIAPGKTKFGFRMIFNTTAEHNKIKNFVIDKNEENFDRLERELETMI